MKQRLLILLAIIGFLSCCAATSAAARHLVDNLPSIAALPSAGFSTSDLRKQLSTLPLHHIEGIWKLTTDGSEIAIIRQEASPSNSTDGVYSVILLKSPNRALRPGTVVGLIAPTAKSNTYEARFYTSSTGSKLYNSRKFHLKLDSEDARIEFDRKKSSFSVNLWRLLPYMWRYSVHKNEQRSDTHGCIRIFPKPELPFEPIYL